MAVAAPATAAPGIFYTDIISGPNSGGEADLGSYLSLFGTGFGDDLSQVRVTVGGGEVARYIYLGPSLGRPDVQQLSVQLGPAAASGPIVVTVAGAASNSDHLFTVRPGRFFFIAHAGDDTTGVVNDISRPFRTGWYVWNLPDFGAGDFIVVIDDGVYDFGSGEENLYTGVTRATWVLLTKSGTSETNPITVYGYPGATPVTFRAAGDDEHVFYSATRTPGQYIVMANFVFDANDRKSRSVRLGFYSAPDESRTDYARLVNHWVLNCLPNWGGGSGLMCISLMNADYLKMYGVQVGPQGATNDSTNGGHPIYQSHRYTEADAGWLYLHDFPNCRGGYQVAGDAWATPREASWGDNNNVRIHDSLFVNLGREAILLNLGSKEVFIYNNVVWNASTMDNGFSAIALRGAELGLGDYYLYNNTVVTDASGIGNAIFELGYSPQGTYPNRVVLQNNIVMAMSEATAYAAFHDNDFGPDRVTSAGNLWFGSAGGLPLFAAADVEADPMFVDAPAGDFHLQPTSPARDGGVDLGAAVPWDYDFNERPQGAAFDIGAYELVPTCVTDADCVAASPCRLDAGATCVNAVCVYPPAPAGAACDDGDACTGDQCDGAGQCLPGACPVCEDACAAALGGVEGGCGCRGVGAAPALQLCGLLLFALSRRRRISAPRPR